MTDHAHEPGHVRHRRHTGSAEYKAYFAVIYLAALPFAFLKWVGLLVSSDAEARRSPFREARAMTETVLPYVFMA